MEIENKVIVVTGGMGGIGFQTVENFLRKQAKFVAVLDRVDSQTANDRLKRLDNEYESQRFGYFDCNVTVADEFEGTFSIISSLRIRQIIIMLHSTQRCLKKSFVRTLTWTCSSTMRERLARKTWIL